MYLLPSPKYDTRWCISPVECILCMIPMDGLHTESRVFIVLLTRPGEKATRLYARSYSNKFLNVTNELAKGFMIA